MQDENIYSKKTYERDGFEVEIKILFDEIPDTSHLGKYTSNGDSNYVVDRRRGVLLGPMVYGTHYLNKVEVDPEYDLEEILGENAFDPETNYENYDWETCCFEIGYNYRPILAHVKKAYDWNAYEYFAPSGDAYLTNDTFKPWSESIAQHAYDEAEEARFAKHDILRRIIPEFPASQDPNFWREILYFAEDYARMEAYNDQEFFYLGYEILVSRDGTDYKESSCWGFESDYTEGMWGEINSIIDYWFEKGGIRKILEEEALDQQLEEEALDQQFASASLALANAYED